MNETTSMRGGDRRQRRAAVAALVEGAGSIQRAASLAGVTRQALYERIAALDGRVVTTKVTRVEWTADEPGAPAA